MAIMRKTLKSKETDIVQSFIQYISLVGKKGFRHSRNNFCLFSKAKFVSMYVLPLSKAKAEIARAQAASSPLGHP